MDITNMPLRKLFCCEIDTLQFKPDSTPAVYEMHLEGRKFDVAIVWLQGRFNRNYIESTVWRLGDASGVQMDITVPDEIRAICQPDDDNYFSILAHLEPPTEVAASEPFTVNSDSSTMIRKPSNIRLATKKLTNLTIGVQDPNLKQERISTLDDLWCLEVFEYHRYLCALS